MVIVLKKIKGGFQLPSLLRNQKVSRRYSRIKCVQCCQFLVPETPVYNVGTEELFHYFPDTRYTNFEKAFAKIDPCLLLLKLWNIGFTNPLLKFLISYLTGRISFVKSTNFSSSSSEVSQGSN